MADVIGGAFSKQCSRDAGSFGTPAVRCARSTKRNAAGKGRPTMADSDYTPAPGLIEALAAELVVLVSAWEGENDGHPDDCSDHAWEMARELTRTFLTTHRLVSLPSECETRWEYLTHDNRWEGALCGARGAAERSARKQRGPKFGPQIRPVLRYTIHGEPIDLTRPTDTGTDTR